MHNDITDEPSAGEVARIVEILVFLLGCSTVGGWAGLHLTGSVVLSILTAIGALFLGSIVVAILERRGG